KDAGERAIDVRPAVRPRYVEIAPSTLETSLGGWERLQISLSEQTGTRVDRAAPPVLRELPEALRRDDGRLTAHVWHDVEVVRVQPGYRESAYGLAIDIGSTTVAAHLCDLRTGSVLATRSAMNPQVRYGEDLMSRVSYAMRETQGTERMHRAIVRTLNELAEAACQHAQVAVDDVLDVVIVGNPIMHHLALGIDPSDLGGAPFSLAVRGSLDLRAEDVGLRLNPAARLHVLPCIAGHVGADHVAVLLAEAPHNADEVSLIVDVGTNAEISVGNRRHLVCASSPTGPAFEGAQITHGQRAAPGAIERVRVDAATHVPRWKVLGSDAWITPATAEIPDEARATGICGSGIIEAVAELRMAGVLRPDGLFDERHESGRLRRNGRTFEYVLVGASASATGSEIVISQSDVRAIQLAKAALHTGARLLMNRLGVERVDQILLAGAFGSYISPVHAMVLGMIPDCDLDRVRAVGNAAGDGARIALLNRDARVEAARLADWVEHVQIAVDPDFQESFVAAMSLPHASESYPHLEGILSPGGETEPRRRRRSAR
ncbi:MAG TPA: ASKHA domain-containing protein, partial [Anaerolineales bacterium]|nr:ASKHA domain-containing protein [Anaerolineales bacterium]